MNARGIPPTVYQVLHLLPYAGGGGGNYPGGGYLPQPGATLTGVGTPQPGYVSSPGVDRQMPVKTVPSPILRMRVVKINTTRKSSCVNTRGIPPARGRKMLTPPPTSWTDLTPPGWTDLTSPPAGWTDLTPPGWTDLTPPPRWLDLTPPAGWTWPPPPRLDLTPPPGVDWQTKWNYYLPVVLRTRAVIMNSEE